MGSWKDAQICSVYTLYLFWQAARGAGDDAAWLVVVVVVAAPGNRNCYTWNRRLTAATNHMARDSVSPV